MYHFESAFHNSSPVGLGNNQGGLEFQCWARSTSTKEGYEGIW